MTGTFTIAETSDKPLVITGVRRAVINNESSRTVVVYHSGGWGEVKNNGTAQKWHLCNIGQINVDRITNAKVWGRWINAEGVRYLTINNCRWVQMGYKSERQDMPGVQINGSSVVEFLGGTFGVENLDTLVQIGNKSQAVIIASNSGPYKSTDPAIVDIGHGSMQKEDFPIRASNYWFFMFAAVDANTSLLNKHVSNHLKPFCILRSRKPAQLYNTKGQYIDYLQNRNIAAIRNRPASLLIYRETHETAKHLKLK